METYIGWILDKIQIGAVGDIEAIGKANMMSQANASKGGLGLCDSKDGVTSETLSLRLPSRT